MPSELDIYKKIRINNLQNILNTKLSRLNNNLSNKIRIIQKSRLKPKVKQIRINKLNNIYNNSVNILNQEFNNNVSTIQSFSPKPIIINKNKKALLIGINYTGTENELYGCINDTNSIKNRLLQNGFNEINILTDLTDVKATKENILNAFKNLLINSQPGDLLFFAYSGHGSYTYDRNNDENTGYDQLIIPSDLNAIVDDDLKSIIQSNLKENVTLFAMFDSCFSGSVLDLKYQYLDSLNYDNYTENNKQLETKGKVLMISGCSDYQTSDEAVINNKATGAMTWSLLETLKQSPNCSWRDLLKGMRNLLKTSEYDQIPQFSSGTFENIDTPVFI
jgi:uncharacterized caspase-like protein